MRIHHGETLTITAAAVDDAGDEVTIDGGWQAACAITRAYADTPVVTLGMPITWSYEEDHLVSATMEISGGVASVSFDTGDDQWSPGRYGYDIRLTDPDGHDYWIDTQELVLVARITGAS